MLVGKNIGSRVLSPLQNLQVQLIGKKMKGE